MLKKLSMTEKNLKDLLDEAGYSYRGLARELEIGHNVLISYGKGATIPRLDSAIALASKLNVSLKTLSAALGQDVSRIPDDCDGGNNGN
jgi:transcriptional regulator with XRE-family HTH domain